MNIMQNRKSYFMHLLLVLFALQPLVAAAEDNNIPTNAENPFTMENGVLTGSRANFKDDHHIDYMMNGDYATYTLNNLVDAQYYTVSFTAGTANSASSVSLNFNIKNDADGTEVCNHDVELQLNGNWDASSVSYDFRTGEMPVGHYTMVITFKSVGGNGTTANVNNIVFTAKKKFDGETVDNQAATVTFPFTAGNASQIATFSEGSENWFKSILRPQLVETLF